MGHFAYTPASGFVGIDSFTYYDVVGTLVSNVASVTLTVDKAPVANNDVYQTTKNVPISISARACWPTTPIP